MSEPFGKSIWVELVELRCESVSVRGVVLSLVIVITRTRPSAASAPLVPTMYGVSIPVSTESPPRVIRILDWSGGG